MIHVAKRCLFMAKNSPQVWLKRCHFFVRSHLFVKRVQKGAIWLLDVTTVRKGKRK
jgi:hypothetical protein